MGSNLDQLRDGYLKSYESLFLEYYEPLVKFANRFVYDIQIGENIVQDVFLKMWENRDKLEFGNSIKSYLYTSVKHLSINHLQKSRTLKKHQETIRLQTIDESTPEDILINQELIKSIELAIQNLPEKARIVFSMSRLDKLKNAEIAEILNISIKAVEAQMTKALKILRKQITSSS